jgi:hypothetical protein
LALFEKSEVWPQDNEAEEEQLRQRLRELGQVSSTEVRSALYDLEEQHGHRRAWVWAELNRASLAMALKSLADLAKETGQPVGGDTLENMVAAYADRGWKADAAVLDALAAVELVEDVAAVKTAIRAVYHPWLEETARAFQKLMLSSDLSQIRPNASIRDAKESTCILFSDALRFDTGQRLVAALEERGYRCQVRPQLTALPTITATAKPAISPVAGLLTGQSSAELTPSVAATQAQLTADVFRRLLATAGYQVLRQEEDLGDPSGQAWTELGAIDQYGHQHGWKIAHHIPGELRALEKRVEALLDHGWARVIVITDHGWLLLPGTLPKVSLPEHLTVLRKGRCARLKEFSDTDQQTVPWFWDQDVRIAIASGSHCYEAGKEYEHGGLSPQECIVPVITVTSSEDATAVPVTIEQVAWKGLRCVIQVSGATPEMRVDIRTKAGDPATSLATTSKSPDQQGKVSLMVEDEDRIGEAAFVVALAKSGLVCAQILTTIGG